MNIMTEKDWNDIDLSSRQIVYQLLSKSTDQISCTSGNCCIDMVFEKGGQKIGVEIKDRSFPSDKYGDVFCEEIKKVCSKRRIDKHEFDKCLVVNVFTNNVLAIASMDDKEAKRFSRKCPQTSLIKGGSKEYVVKDCLSLPQRIKIKFQLVDGRYIFKRN